MVYISPIGGGKAVINGETIRAISPSSPLGSAMIELETGDHFEVDSPRGLINYAVVDIS